MALTQVKADGLAADLIDETKLADNSIDSEHYNDGSIDHEHLANDAVDGDIIADNAVGLAHMAHGTDGNLITYDTNGAPGFVDTGTSGHFLKSQGSGNVPVFAAIPASGIADVVSDTTPQLGGNLDINGQDIVSASNANIDIVPNGTGDVTLQADTVQVGDSNADASITTNGTGDLTLSTNSGTNSGTIEIEDGANNDIVITPNGSGDVILDGLKYPQADGSADQVLKTDGSAQLSWTTVTSGVSSDNDTNTVAGTNAGNAGTWSGANGNTCMGYNSGTDLTSGDYNTLHGEESGANLTTGYKNVAIGCKALEVSTNGFENVVIGWSALPVVPYGTQNVAIGCKALESGDDAGIREEVAVGFEALKDVTGNYTNAYGNTALGYQAGRDNDNKYEMCFIGRQAGMNQTMVSQELWIAHRDHNKGTASCWIHGTSNGEMTNGNNSSSWSTTSDERIKKNIVDNNVGLEKLNQLKVRNFEYRVQKETGTDSEGHTTWTHRSESDIIDTSTFNTLPNGQKPRPDQVAINKEGVQVGCIAQEVEAVLPGCVHTDTNGVKSVDTDEMFWVMVNAIKQLSAKNDALTTRVAALEAA